jgi:hypothetical protein
VITQFQSTADDDPKAIVVAPAGFNGTDVDPGDLLILDSGADGNGTNAIYLYRPSAPFGNPAAYGEFFMTSGDFGAYVSDWGTDLDFSPDGSSLYVSLSSDVILEVDADGTIVRELTLTGGPLSNIEGIEVNPADGRIWVADDTLDQVWSYDPVTGDGRAELTFVLGGETRLDYNINFPVPSMKFTADGSRLVITDTGAEGWLWVLDTERPIGPDYDCDGDVDLSDFGVLGGCLEGPGEPTCAGVDLDGDEDVDLGDFAVFQKCFSGDGQPADANCDD